MEPESQEYLLKRLWDEMEIVRRSEAAKGVL